MNVLFLILGTLLFAMFFFAFGIRAGKALYSDKKKITYHNVLRRTEGYWSPEQGFGILPIDDTKPAIQIVIEKKENKHEVS